MKKALLFFALSGCVVLSGASPMPAQSFGFGKNKVSYDDFDWQVLEGDHFDVYYYPEERQVARLALLEAERSYEFLREKLDHELTRRVPFIVYSSHEHFEQTNVIPVMISEGVLGFTEYLKGRVAIPFGGSVSAFSKTIRHEMVHVFQFDIIQNQYDLYRRVRIDQPPLWFTEGIAEYFSNEPRPRDEMFVRDMIQNDRLDGVRGLYRFGGSFPVYKGGESFLHFLAGRYGEGMLTELLHSLWKSKTFSEAIRNTTGKRLGELSDEWMEELRERYAHDERESAADRAVRLTREDEVATMPTGYLDSEGRERVLCFSSRFSTMRIESLDPADPDTRNTIITSGKDARFESLHPFGSGMDVGEGGLMVFSSKHGEKDALNLWDPVRQKLVDDIRFDDILEIRSPALAPDGRRIAFSGLAASGMSDIYIYDRGSGELVSVTHDFYDDLDPDWSPDGSRIVFASDRTAHGAEGFTNLFVADLETSGISYLTFGRWNDSMPHWSPDGDVILFMSDRDGYVGIYTVDEQGRGAPVIEMREGVFSVDWGPGGYDVVFTALKDLSLGVWRADYFEPGEHTFELDPDGGAGTWIPEVGSRADLEADSNPYDTRYSFDIATGGIGFSNAYGTSQGGRFMLSDMLGDKVILFQVDNAASQFGDVLRSWNVTVAYLNLKHRLNFGIGAFHTRGNFVDLGRSDFPFFEQRHGGFLLLSYPFSRFLRAETTMSLFRSERRDVVETFDRDSFLAANSVSLVKDNTVWLIMGPIEGERYRVGFTLTNDISRAAPDNVAFGVDYRRYIRTGLASGYALRLVARMSDGTLPERYFLGGSWGMRGYPRFSIIGTRAVLLNQEWRVLLLRRALKGPGSRGFWLPPVEGALFLDAGNAWDETDRGVGVIGSFGAGLRVGIAGPFIFRFDFSKRTDFSSVEGGVFFDFWLGYDY